ncbi:hypothetical protein [Streptomyces longispororuber]|uniref:hypothetical protein n=1 Tax=Streptomyces longispororuber TaxID=68230 RepID=UPI00167C9404|nr:hypothetical protein [Streptomyces longispororuber]
MQTGTALAGVAAVGGIVVTGIATYYSARTAEDQLKQSQEDADETTRSQSSKVAFYSDVEDDLTSRRYYLVNRSADPISRVHVMILADVEWKKQKGAEPHRQSSQLILWLGSVPPCSGIVLRSRDMTVDPTAKANRRIPRGAAIHLDQYFKVDSIYFNDSGGRRWKRTLDELTRWVQPADAYPAPPEPVTDVSILQVKLRHKVLLDSVKPCGGA